MVSKGQQQLASVLLLLLDSTHTHCPFEYISALSDAFNVSILGQIVFLATAATAFSQLMLQF